MTNSGLLLNEVLPQYDVSAIYSIRIKASPENIFRILQKGLPQGRATRLLMALRSFPRFFQRQCKSIDGDAFYRLKEARNQEIVLGIAGQFWKPVAVIVPIRSLDDFIAFEKANYCKAAINLRISPTSDSECLVSTETRILAFGSAKKKFSRYWKLIAPFSGLIRMEALRKIKRNAESVTIV